MKRLKRTVHFPTMKQIVLLLFGSILLTNVIMMTTASSSSSSSSSFFLSHKKSSSICFILRGGSDESNKNENNTSETSSSPPQNHLAEKKKKKKKPNPSTNTKQKQAPNTKQQTSKNKKTHTTTSAREGECLRRIKREWRDAVRLGIAYNWITMETIVIPKKKKKRRTLPLSENDVSTNDNTTSASCNNDTLVENKQSLSSEEEEENDNNYNYVRIGPFGKNLLQWHFSVMGPPNSVYAHGIYHGRVLLPRDYPGSPPRIQILTPSGRFIPGADICLSASSYHPESWTPRWTILSLVDALRLHMLTTANEIGGVQASDTRRRTLALESRVWVKRGLVDHRRMVAAGIFALTSASLREVGDGGDTKEDVVDDGGGSKEDGVVDDDGSSKEDGAGGGGIDIDNDAVDLPSEKKEDETIKKKKRKSKQDIKDKQEQQKEEEEIIKEDNNANVAVDHHHPNPKQQQLSGAAAATTATAIRHHQQPRHRDNETLARAIVKAMIADIIQSPIRLAFVLLVSIFAMRHL